MRPTSGGRFRPPWYASFMKIQTALLHSVLLAGLFASTVSAQPDAAKPDAAPPVLGREKAFTEYTKIKVTNFDDEPLGRIVDLGVDLVNGRIVEVLIAADSSLEVGNKVIAVPPGALITDLTNEVYRINVSPEQFKSAAAIDLSKWKDEGRSDRVAATYYHFGQMPYFLEEGETASPTAKRPRVALGYVERSNKVVGLPVGNLQGENLGKVWTMTLDIPTGRILNVIVLAPGNFETKRVIPAMALRFNDARDALVLNKTKAQFADEPAYVATAAAFGQDAYSEQEAYSGPRTQVALVQGKSNHDIDRTVLINKNIRLAKIDRRNVQVGTFNGRVTLRGWVNSETTKKQINDIAVAASRVEVVDNQITVGKPATE